MGCSKVRKINSERFLTFKHLSELKRREDQKKEEKKRFAICPAKEMNRRYLEERRKFPYFELYMQLSFFFLLPFFSICGNKSFSILFLGRQGNIFRSCLVEHQKLWQLLIYSINTIHRYLHTGKSRIHMALA